MRICLISQEYPPETGWGGIGSYTRTLAEGLAVRGHTVHVVSRSLAGKDYSYLDRGVRVHRLSQPATQGGSVTQEYWTKALAWSQRVKEKVLEIADADGLDVIELPEFEAEGYSLVDSSEVNIPLVVRLHTPTFITAKFNAKPWASGDNVIDALERAVVLSADLITAPSRLVVHEVDRHWRLGREVEVIPNPVDTRAFCPRGPRERRLTGYPTILYLGRLEPLKNPDALLFAVPAVVRRFPGAKFVFVGRDTASVEGDRSYFRRLQRVTNELGIDRANLRFILGLAHDQVARHLRNADVVVLPSRFDNLPYSALEALACGIPMIVGEKVGVSEYVGPADGVFTVDPDDVDRIAKLLIELLNDRAALDQLSQRARAAALEKFGADVLVPRFENLYERAARLGAGRTEVSAAQGIDGKAIGGRGVLGRGRARDERPRLGIIVLTHNAQEYTRLCIQSIMQWTDTDFELHVVDNASTDGTREWLLSLADNRVYVHLMNENLGVPGGRNEGILGLGEVDYVVFLDNDVEVYAGWWQRLLEGFTDPLVGITGHQGFRLVQLQDGRLLEPVRGNRTQPCDVLTGYAMMVRRKVIEEVGLFDEALGKYWFDDDDYCVRILNLGYECMVVPRARLIHYGSKSSATSSGVMAMDRASANAAYLYEKWTREGMVGPDGRPRRPDRCWLNVKPILSLPLRYNIDGTLSLRVLVAPPGPTLESWVEELARVSEALREREGVLVLLPLSDPFLSREEMAQVLMDALRDRGIAESDGIQASIIDRWNRPSTILASLRSCDLLVVAEGTDGMVKRYANQLGIPVTSSAALLKNGTVVHVGS